MSVPCMDRDPREQERVELQKAGAQAPEGFAENIPVLRDSEAYTMDFEHPLVLRAEEPGMYFMEAGLSSASPEMSQVFMEFLLNGSPLLQVQMGGTRGKVTVRNLAKVRMEAGYYLLEAKLQKPDISIAWVRFRKLA